jgi:hypothetical protein
MPHSFSGAFEEAGPVGERRSMEEPDIHVSPKGVDVGKCRVFHTGDGMAVVQELANIRAAAAHAFKPWLRHPSQFVVGFTEPHVDAAVSLNGAREP